MSRDSSVDVAIGYGLVGRGSIPGRAKRFYSTPKRTVSQAHSISCPMGIWNIFSGVKWQGSEAKNYNLLRIRLHGVVFI
jgi:hypothetical protein